MASVRRSGSLSSGEASSEDDMSHTRIKSAVVQVCGVETRGGNKLCPTFTVTIVVKMLTTHPTCPLTTNFYAIVMCMYYDVIVTVDQLQKSF